MFIEILDEDLTARYGLSVDETIDQKGKASIDIFEGSVHVMVKFPDDKGTLAQVDIPIEVLRMAVAIAERQHFPERDYA
ncbi:MAG: hypothetical protein ACO3SJ_08560 [Phycisphaerales bacterium]